MNITIINHDLIPDYNFLHILYKKKDIFNNNGIKVNHLYQIWIILNNEKQLNSYTTDMVKEVIIAFRKASNDRNCIAIIFTAVGSRSFCTGGNTEEYATYYANRPLEYLQYMRLFNDMITTILTTDKPVINRINGLRIAGGQEIGMACDFSIAGDHVKLGQAGPKHGSAPDGGSTDFLHLYLGYTKAVESLVLCELWSAHKALYLGLINQVVPVFKNQKNHFIANPLIVNDQYRDIYGNLIYGNIKTNNKLKDGKKY